jgi:DNA-binding transcriptional regulator YdaS (Cro superfamily)
MNALERAIEIVGGQAALAERIGKKQGHVAMWLKRGKVPAEVCADIEAATNAAVSCQDLRPDVFRTPSNNNKPAGAAEASSATASVGRAG